MPGSIIEVERAAGLSLSLPRFIRAIRQIRVIRVVFLCKPRSQEFVHIK